MTVDRWIALASSLGTLVAALIAALSIRELRLQRSQQFRPRITPTIARYQVTVDPEDLLDFENSSPKVLPIINVGHGVATDLQITWDIDVDDWISRVNALSAKRGAGVGVQQDEFGLAVYAGGKHKGGVRVPEAEGDHFPYILPVTANRDPINAPIPGAVATLLSAYYWSYFLGLGIGDSVYRNPKPEFQINIRMNYKDTVGRAYSRRSTLRVGVLLEGERPDSAAPMKLQFAVQPTITEPAEGYSTITKLLLKVLKSSVDGVKIGI